MISAPLKLFLGWRVVVVIFLLSGSLVFLSESSNAQVDSTDVEQLENYNWRIMQRNLHGIYIPYDIYDAFEELKANSSENSLRRFRDAPEEEIGRRLFFGIGGWMRNNWQFFEGSRFSHYLRGLGLTHPDDMTVFMIESFHRYLNDRDLEKEKRIKYLQEERKRINQMRWQTDTLKIDTIIH